MNTDTQDTATPGIQATKKRREICYSCGKSVPVKKQFDGRGLTHRYFVHYEKSEQCPASDMEVRTYG